MIKSVLSIAALSISALQIAGPATALAQPYDLVLEGGRVMDPESGLDAVRHVGIANGMIAAISEGPLEGRETVDVSGLVVAPGFIDLHAHGQHRRAQDLQARDGVTTALEMESGAYPVADFYARREGKALINYGATVNHICIRIKIKFDLPCGDLMAADLGAEANERVYRRKPATAYHEPLSDNETAAMLGLFEEGLRQGGLGIGLGIEYTPGAGRKEIYDVFKLAAAHGAPVFVHVRRRPPDSAPGVPIAVAQEAIANAAVTGAPLQIVHVTSTGLGDAPVIIDMVENARARGIDVTTEVYPYTAGSTTIGAALFDDGWRAAFGVDYDALVWTATGERLTEATFRRYRKEQPGGWVILHVIPEDIVRYAVAHPAVSIASDGIPWITGNEHPRGAGTFARVLGRYVREERALSLMAALRKMTIMPARRLERFVPAMAAKGRIKVGADADLTVFDPMRVIDRATFDDPMQPSDGIDHVMVGGTFVVRDGALVPGLSPGRPVRNGIAEDQ